MSLTPALGHAPYTVLMEWMLQVVDEVDDVVGALGLFAMGMRTEIGLLVAGGAGAGAGVLCAALFGAG